VEIKCQLDATDVFYCRSYCLLNMFRAPLCPSSGAREYYTVGCRLRSLVLGFQVFGMVWSWGLCVRFAGCPQARKPDTWLIKKHDELNNPIRNNNIINCSKTQRLSWFGHVHRMTSDRLVKNYIRGNRHLQNWQKTKH
jgi:hypothetical protein